ncbi:MAG: CoA-binding protein, partial [Thermococcus sp.]
MNLDYFFKPKGIAVIGASNDPMKLGYEVFKNLKKYMDGKVYPVNVKDEVVQGVKAYKNVKDIPDEVDLAIIVVPKRFVKQSIIDCGEKGVKGAVIITAGFGETGEEGKKEEKELVEIAHKYGMRLIGPNCVGVMNTHNDMNATFIMDAKKGSIAFVSQSGALGAGIVYKTVKEGIGFSKFISLGNMADLDFAELMEYLADTEEDRAIALYIEGLKDGRKFIEVAKRVTK